MWFNSCGDSQLQGETVMINLKVTYHCLKLKEEQQRSVQV